MCSAHCVHLELSTPPQHFLVPQTRASGLRFPVMPQRDKKRPHIKTGSFLTTGRYLESIITRFSNKEFVQNVKNQLDYIKELQNVA